MLQFDPSDLSKLKSDLATISKDLEEIEIKDILIGQKTIDRLPDLIGDQKFKKILLVMDDTPISAGNRDVKEHIFNFLQGHFKGIEKIILKHADNPGGVLHADFHNVEIVKRKLSSEYIVISIGSGTITDITKHATFLFAKENNATPLPFIVVQTANTVTAFTSNIAVLFKDGVKRTYPSRYPDYVVCDLDILMNAPLELTQAGFGDLLARFVSYADWYLGYRLKNLDKYSEVPKMLLDESLDFLLQHPHALKEKNPDVFNVLTKALLNAGISMSIVGMSTPISGFEHVISHVLDMLATVNNKESVLHGLQVGLTTVMSAYVYEEILKSDSVELFFPEWIELEKNIRKDFLDYGFDEININEMLNDYKIKFDKWIAAKNSVSEFINNWDIEKIKIQKLLKSGDELKKSLQQAEVSLKLNDFNPPIDPQELKFAFLHAHFIRRRFTIGDFLYFAGKLDKQLFERVIKSVGND